MGLLGFPWTPQQKGGGVVNLAYARGSFARQPLCFDGSIGSLLPGAFQNVVYFLFIGFKSRYQLSSWTYDTFAHFFQAANMQMEGILNFKGTTHVAVGKTIPETFSVPDV